MAFLIPVAENSNRICSASVVRMHGWQLPIFLGLAFPLPFIILFFLSRNAYIGKNIVDYGTNQNLDKNPLISQGLTPSCSNSRITNISWFHLALPSPGLAVL